MTRCCSSRGHGGPARLGLARCALAGLLALSAGAARAADPQEPPIRIGFTPAIFKSRNQNDVIAAMRVWAQTVARDRGVPLDPHMTIFRDLKEAEAAIRGQQVDALTLALPEYAVFSDGLLSGPFFRDEVNGSTLVEFVLAAATNGPVRQVGDLRNARVSIHDGEQADVAMAWLEAQVAAAGLGRLASAAASVELNEKASAAVLSVFFGKADACLVRRGVLASVAELNPQVAKRLAIVAASEPIVPTLFAFRADLPEASKDRFFREVLRIHESVAGQQVLRVFKSDRMQSPTAEEVARSVRLLNGWRQQIEQGAP